MLEDWKEQMVAKREKIMGITVHQIDLSTHRWHSSKTPISQNEPAPGKEALFGGMAQKGHRRASLEKHGGQRRKSHESTQGSQVGAGVGWSQTFSAHKEGSLWILSSFSSWMLSHVRLFVTPWTVAYQAPLSMGFSRQEYWSGLPCPPPGGLPDPGIKSRSLMSPALADGFFTTEPPGKPSNSFIDITRH